jgi:5-methylthioadenosine/S-adenosylhomocysteine deaminase
LVDILIKNGFLLTMKGEGVGALEDGAVAIEGNQIVAVGKTQDVERQFPSTGQTFDARGKAVLPGFVDAHIHTGMTILRGQGQDVPEIEWMLKTQGPFGRYTTSEHRLKASTLGVLEALKSGTTCFGEIGAGSEVVEKVYVPSGVRAKIGSTINEISPGSQRSAYELYEFDPAAGERRLAQSLDMVNKWHGAAGGRITCLLAPQAADMVSRELLLRVKEIAKEKDLLVHIHIAQGGREEIQMKLRYGKSAPRFLDEIGFLDSSVIGAHCHQTTDEEVALLAQRKIRYVSCPSSISIIDGITPPLQVYLAAGGQAAGLGSDQASGNNSHNMMTELKIAALLNKTRHRDPTVLPAWKVLRIATIEGASCIGLDREIGSLEEGKKADLMMLNLKVPHLTPVISTPVRNVAPNIVYSARGDEVETVIVDGKVLMENRRALTMNEESVIEEAQRAAEEVTSKAAEDYYKADSLLAKTMKKGLL